MIDINELMHRKIARQKLDDIRMGARLRGLRRYVGWPQKTLAFLTGISVERLQQYERGARRIEAHHLVDFAALLQVSLGYFFVDLPIEDYAKQSRHGAAVLAHRETLDLLRAVSGLHTPEQRRRALTLVRRLAKSDSSEAVAATPMQSRLMR